MPVSAATVVGLYIQVWKFVMRCFLKTLHKGWVGWLMSHTDKDAGTLHETLNIVNLKQNNRNDD